jgi:hypothetical protein
MTLQGNATNAPVAHPGYFAGISALCLHVPLGADEEEAAGPAELDVSVGLESTTS